MRQLDAKKDLAVRLRELDGRVFPAGSEPAKQLARMLIDNVHGRIRAAIPSK